MTPQRLTPHQSQYYAWLLTRRAGGDTVESLASTLVDSQVDLNPHQVEAALFACKNPLSLVVILADEVGLGKTIEAGLVISQRWAERRRRILIIVPANLRKQWHQELQDKFGLQGLILEAKSYNAIAKQERRNPFLMNTGPVICSYQFAKAKDVVVVNFVDRSNEADARVYELLAEKFQLFDGVFGVIGSGIDFERRIAEIYQNCRDSEAIKASFEQLQLDLSGEINEAMVKARQLLLDHFDEAVQEKLRVRAEDSRLVRGRFERMLMELTQAELGDCAEFDEGGFVLRHSPSPDLADIALGRYELPRRSGDAHLYRIGHPLAEWITNQAKARRLPPARLVFDYEAYGTQVSTLKTYRGQTGWLTVCLLTVEALGSQEQHLIAAACTATGNRLEEDDPEGRGCFVC